MKLVYGLTCLRANESCLAFAKRIVCGSIISLIIASTSFAQISVNWNDVHQQIDGFGASSAWTAPSLSDSQADLFFSTTSGVGLSLLRSRVAPDGTTTELVTMQKAQARGARVWSTPWSPPAAWKDNNDVNWGGHLLTNHYQDYANQLAAYVANAKAAGVNLYAISIQNEPDCWASYESCLWSARQFHDFVPYLYNALASYGVSATKILMPEQGSWTFALASTAMADANTVNMIGVVGAHSYGTTASAVNSYGKRLWMTEMCSSVTSYDGGIGDGLTWALSIHQYMTIAEANAWHYWWLIPNSSDNQALTDQYGNPAKRLYTLGNFSKFVRPGWYRVGTSDDGWVLISAYQNPNTSQFAIVCINVWGNNLTRTIALKGFSSTSVTPWLTSSSANLAQQSDVAILGSSFSYTFPAQSVVTFVGTSATAPTWSTNASSANWSAASSWSPSSVPASGSDVTFGSGGSTSVVNTTSRTVRNVLLERGTNFVIANSGGASLTISNGITVADSFSYAVSAPLVLGNSNTWFVNDSGTLQVSGAVSGGTPLTKAGNGMLTLSGGNTFTGNILVNGGTLQGASASVLNSVKTLTISAGTTLEITDSWQPASGTTVFNGNGTLQFDNGLV